MEDPLLLNYTKFSLPEGAKLRLGKGKINGIQYSPDGTRLAVATSIGVWLYNMPSYHEVALLNEYRFTVKAKGWLRRILLTRLAKSKYWCPFRLQQRDAFLAYHTAIVNCLAFSPDGKTLASGDKEGAICLWDAHTGNPLGIVLFLRPKNTVNSVAFSPDGSTIASGHENGTIGLWKARTGKFLRTLTEHTFDVNCVAFSPGGLLLPAGVRTTPSVYGLQKQANISALSQGKGCIRLALSKVCPLVQMDTCSPARAGTKLFTYGMLSPVVNFSG